MRAKRPVRIAMALFLALVLADVCLSLVAVGDGLFLGYPLPPYGAITHPRQEEWLAGLRAQEAGDPAGHGGIGHFDAELGWDWLPSSASVDGLFHINDLGARGTRDYAPLPPEGTTRVLFFGDSFAFGDEITDTATFEHLLEQRNPDLEVLNFGVSGYGTDQAFLRYRRVGKGLGAHVVCIGLMLENIGRNVNRYRPLWNTVTGFCSAKPRFVLDEAGELRLVPQPYTALSDLVRAVRGDKLIEDIAEHEYWLHKPPVPTGRASSLARIVAGALAQKIRSPARLWSDPEGEPFQVTLAILEAFHQEALADGARQAPVVIFPSRGAFHEHALQGRSYWQGLLDELERRGVPYIDLIPALVARQREIDAEPQASLFFGGHFTIVGNSVVADEIAAWLRAHPLR